MTKAFLLLFCALSTTNLFGQDLSPNQLLNKAIAYHDPQGNWVDFKGQLFITMETPNSSDRLSEITIDLPQQYFKLVTKKDNIITEQIINKGSCKLLLNGSETVSEDEIAKHRLTCDRTQTMRNYYTYLYGLPMKLKNPGTLLDRKVYQKTFKGKIYDVLKVTYDEAVGKDTWYFYFDPATYALEVYQFYHDEEKNDGEYIILNGLEEINGIKMPKIRAWYYNKDDKYLGTDTLTKTSALTD
ncbi:MAG: DUF6503 family protein [Eudoraea sp.]|uniref:DUF6503 family protein n=1 Tax=Eudoraea sp. TaxID=1979955 RepID=UPI003C74FAFC